MFKVSVIFLEERPKLNFRLNEVKHEHITLEKNHILSNKCISFRMVVVSFIKSHLIDINQKMRPNIDQNGICEPIRQNFIGASLSIKLVCAYFSVTCNSVVGHSVVFYWYDIIVFILKRMTLEYVCTYISQL